METTLSLINASACGLIAVVLMGVILSPRVRDGIVIKAGLISMSLGFGSMGLRMLAGLDGAGEVAGVGRALLLINAGIAVVIIGYLTRRAAAGTPVRRVTDWMDLDETGTAPR